MPQHPFFGIQNDVTPSNPPEVRQLSVKYITGPTGEPQLSISIGQNTAQHKFASPAEAEDFYISQVLANSRSVKVENLVGALGLVINRVGNKIAAATRRGFATDVFINDRFVEDFDRACNSVIRTFSPSAGATLGRFTQVGTLTNMNVWASPAIPRDRVIVLYRSSSDVSADVDVSAELTNNAYGNWVTLVNNYADYAGVIEL